MTYRLSAWRVAAVGSVLVAAIGACGSKTTSGLPIGAENPGTGGNGDDASTGSGGGDNGSGGSSGGIPGGSFSGSSSGSTTMGGPTSADAACASSTQRGEQQGLNAYIMLDYSGSMAMDGKWTGATAAINSFVQSATSGISVGLQYFGLPNTDPDAGSILGVPIGDSCDPTVYAQPAIEIAPLPGVGGTITASLAAHKMPNTSTPTPPALQGAIDHATAWSMAHPKDVTIVILATDGDPSECGSLSSTASLLQQVETIAAAGVAQTPKMLTFVIGVGTDTSNLNGIAMAGGTGSAFIVDTTMNVSQQFLAALNKIRGAALGCQYKIPVPQGGGNVDFDKVNVQFTPGNGKPMVVPYVSDKSKCPSSGNAWYYDNAANPTEILLCTTTCGTVSAGGQLDVLTGCQRVDVPAK
jgi:von Willebrand factor type A domain